MEHTSLDPKSTGQKFEGIWKGSMKFLPLDLSNDFAEVYQLLVQEQWPFVREDLEISDSQERATAFVARKDGQLAGFFTAHHFGDIGYLDMMVVPKKYRTFKTASHLYYLTTREMKRKGLTSLVVHTTNDSAPLIRFLGFKPQSYSFTLIFREPGTTIELNERLSNGTIQLLGQESLPEIIQLDESIFGMNRATWFESMAKQPTVKFIGYREDRSLKGVLTLRPRQNNAYCLEPIATLPDVQESLVLAAVSKFGGHHLQCFVKTDSALQAYMIKHHGFYVPEFFKAIGPLIEWRKGPVPSVGISEKINAMLWL